MLSGKIYELRFSDGCIVDAYNAVAANDNISHTDAPTEGELVMVRNLLPVDDTDMVSLHWLRNQIVRLRKANKLHPRKVRGAF